MGNKDWKSEMAKSLLKKSLPKPY